MQSNTTNPFSLNGYRQLFMKGQASSAFRDQAAPALVNARAASKSVSGIGLLQMGSLLYFALEKGLFKEAGLDVEGIKFGDAFQIMKSMLIGAAIEVPRAPAQPNWLLGTLLRLANSKSLHLIRANVKNSLNIFMVALASPFKTTIDLEVFR